MPVFVHPKRVGVSPTKDLGSQHARGDVLVFLDGHCKPESGALERLVADVEQLASQAIVIPSIPVLDAETWRNNLFQVGHGYRIDLDGFGTGFVGRDRLQRHAAATATMLGGTCWLSKVPPRCRISGLVAETIEDGMNAGA